MNDQHDAELDETGHELLAGADDTLLDDEDPEKIEDAEDADPLLDGFTIEGEDEEPEL